MEGRGGKGERREEREGLMDGGKVESEQRDGEMEERNGGAKD